jgi:hypothetical protein
MKKIVPIFLLVCLIAPLTGAYVYLQYKKQHIKRAIKWEMIAALNKKELVHLKFSKQDADTKLMWEHSKEFEFNNEMYDVVATEVSRDSVTYICWWDYEETKLNRDLNTLVADYLTNTPVNNKGNERVFDFYKDLFCSQTTTSYQTYYCISMPISLEYLCIQPNSLKYSPPSPPPEFYS